MYPGIDYASTFQTPGVTPEELAAARASVPPAPPQGAPPPPPPPAQFPGGIPQGGGYAAMVAPGGGPVRPLPPGAGPQPMGSSSAAFAASAAPGQPPPVPYGWQTGGPAQAMSVPGAEVGMGGGPVRTGSVQIPAGGLGQHDPLAQKKWAAIGGLWHGDWSGVGPYLKAKKQSEQQASGTGVSTSTSTKLPDPGY